MFFIGCLGLIVYREQKETDKNNIFDLSGSKRDYFKYPCYVYNSSCASVNDKMIYDHHQWQKHVTYAFPLCVAVVLCGAKAGQTEIEALSGSKSERGVKFYRDESQLL